MWKYFALVATILIGVFLFFQFSKKVGVVEKTVEVQKKEIIDQKEEIKNEKELVKTKVFQQKIISKPDLDSNAAARIKWLRLLNEKKAAARAKEISE